MHSCVALAAQRATVVQILDLPYEIHMNLRSMQLFRMIVRTGSLISAAERMGMGPSSASRLIGILEHELKLKLFSRSHRNLELTAEGHEFLQRCQHILEGLEKLPEIALQVRSVQAEPLRLVTTAPIAVAVMAPALGKWRKEHPKIKSILNVETRFDLESKVASREYNLGVVSLPMENAIIDLDIVPLVRARYEVALPIGHPLTRKPSVTVAELAQVDMIALKEGQRWRTRLNALFSSQPESPCIMVETSSTVAALELVRQGMGVTLVDRICAGLTEPEHLEFRALEPGIWTEYCLVSGHERRSKTASEFTKVLREWIYEMRSASTDIASSVTLVSE
jgi:DNA-binding transcriptional LysR family regulator